MGRERRDFARVGAKRGLGLRARCGCAEGAHSLLTPTIVRAHISAESWRVEEGNLVGVARFHHKLGRVLGRIVDATR